MKISIVSGVCVLPDAISYSIVRKLDVFHRSFTIPGQLDYRVFVFDTNVADPRIRIYLTPGDLAMDSFFSSSDVVIYEFGILCSLFNTIFVLPSQTRKLVIYHNITPEHLVEREDQKRGVRLGMAQRANMKFADHIAAVSNYNRLDLLRYGIPPEKTSVLHLPVADGFTEDGICLKPPRRVAELLYVGRFVASKGILDLVNAVIKAARSGASVRLTLVGDTEFSDSSYVQAVRAAIAESHVPECFRFVGAVSQEQLIAYYRDADIFVIPSYHEGYCLPVLEALRSGCLVIAYDAGNLPFIVNRLGRIVPAGHIPELASAISDLAACVLSQPGSSHRLFRLDCGAVTAREYLERCRSYTSAFTFDHFASQFRLLLQDLTPAG